MASNMTRRGFLRASAAVGGGLIVAFELPGCARHSIKRREMAEHAEKTGELMASAWITITRDSRIIYTLDRVEMGQGTMTSHAMMVAEELEVEPGAIEIALAPADRAYDNTTLGFQVTGGSTSVVSSWEPLRKAAAATREMLRQAAAITWAVPLVECEARGGEIVHTPSSRRARYGELTEIAAFLEVPDVDPKPRDRFRVLGTPVGRVDARAKVDGTANYGIDVVVPGMLTAVLVRPPVPGATVRSLRADAARAQKGVRHVLETPRGIAVVAETYWQARRAAAGVEVEWDEGPLASFDSEALRRALAEKARSSGKVVREDGDAGKAIARAPRTVEAVYEVPYLAHATMEPQSCTAHVTRDHCEIWAPTQAPGMGREIAARITGLAHRDVTVHSTLLGGGFGRRLQQDYLAEAVYVSRAVGAPVKVVWSREDDMQHDYYRPQTYNLLRGAVSADGRITGWFHRIAAQSILSQIGPDWLASLLPNWAPQVAKLMMGSSAARMIKNNVMPDQTSVEGAAQLPYGIGNVQVEYVEHEPGVPIGFWRSVGHSENAFVVESFIDELAHAADRDPYELRRVLLGRAPRHLAVLERAAKEAGWGTPTAPGVGRGIAVHESFGSVCAEVAEVSIEGGAVRVHRVVCVIDCGFALNPDIVAAQMESAVVFGLSAALRQEITFVNGRVQQSNFHDYPVLRMFEMPRVEVHIMASERDPSGAGEPGLPPIAPAVANAIFAATGIRIRKLPIEPELERALSAQGKSAGAPARTRGGAS